MKPFRPTIIAALLVAALAAFTIYDYKKNGDIPSDPKAGEQHPLFDLVKEDIHKISLHHGEETVELERTGEEWRVTKPLQDLAESGAVDSFLYLALAQKGKVFRSKEESASVNWAEYGLLPPMGSIELAGRDKSVAVQVSTKNAFDGSFYVRKGDDLLLGDRGLAQIADRQANSFRSRRLWRQGETPIKSVEVEWTGSGKSEKYRFVVEDSHWKMEPKPGYAIDGERVDHWIKRLQNLIPAEVTKDGLDKGTKRRYLLLKPSFKVKIEPAGKDGVPWTFIAGQDKDTDVYVYTDQQATVYKSSEVALRQIRVGPDFFRDGKAPFRFNLEHVAELEVIHPKFHHKFKKDGTTWSLVGEDPAKKVDQDKLERFFQDLHALEAQEFLPGLTRGFAAEHRVILRDAKDTVVFELQWDGVYNSKRPYNNGMALRKARTNLSESPIALPADKLGPLSEESLVSAPAKKPGVKAENDHH